MQQKSLVLLKVLQNRFHAGEKSSFKGMPQEEAKEIDLVDTSSQDLAPAFSWPDTSLKQTHYSWLAPVIEKMPKCLQPAVIASLSQHQAVRLARVLNLKLPPPPSPTAQKFFRRQLYSLWNPQEAFPIEYLPKGPLNDLLSLRKDDLIDLIDLLSMYDLSDAMRHIVDKKQLKKVYQCLSPHKQQFLRLCLHKKEKIAAPKLDIDKWDGSPEKLNTLLHRRGMLRLGKALCGQSQNYMWHMTHKLDAGRGKAVAQYYQEHEIPNVTQLLVQQIFTVMNFLKPKSEE